MPRRKNSYPTEFEKQLVALARSGRSVESLAREFEPPSKVGPLLSHQPDHFQITLRFSFSTTARTYTVQITIDVNFQQIARVISQPARSFGASPIKTHHCEIQAVNKGLDKPNHFIRP